MYFKGDQVCWASTSNGSTTEKVGVYLGEIPPGGSARSLFPVLTDISTSQNKVSQDVSSAYRALVRVDRVDAKGNVRPWYYAPRKSALKKK